jgi:hypothetical protein
LVVKFGRKLRRPIPQNQAPKVSIGLLLTATLLERRDSLGLGKCIEDRFGREGGNLSFMERARRRPHRKTNIPPSERDEGERRQIRLHRLVSSPVSFPRTSESESTRHERTLKCKTLARPPLSSPRLSIQLDLGPDIVSELPSDKTTFSSHQLPRCCCPVSVCVTR